MHLVVTRCCVSGAWKQPDGVAEAGFPCREFSEAPRPPDSSGHAARKLQNTEFANKRFWESSRNSSLYHE